MTRRIIALDPGLSSGLCAVDLGGSGLSRVFSAELDFRGCGSALKELLFDSDPGITEVVVERFTITAQTAKNSQAPWSLEVIGMCRWLVDVVADGAFGEMVMQGPAEAKRLVGNEVLRRAGVWHVGGAGHANDALRHAVYRFARTSPLDTQIWNLD